MHMEMSYAKGDPQKEWHCYATAARKAHVDSLLSTALEAAKRELKARPQSTMRPRNLEAAAREFLIKAVKQRPATVPDTWRVLAGLRESVILIYAVDEVIDAHHAAHPEDGCGK